MIPIGWRLANRFAVPRTGRKAGCHWFRYPRNASIKRAIVAASGTLRGEKHPPSAWDDIPRANADDRSWKRFRLTRWKQKKRPTA